MTQALALKCAHESKYRMRPFVLERVSEERGRDQ